MNRPNKLWIVVLLFTVLAGSGASARGQEVVPETMGVSSERLRRIDSAIEGYVDRGEFAGVVTLMLRGGEVVHLNAVGFADREAGVPMTTDAIFRIASMSKAVTTVAAMMLIEEGRLGLQDPVSRFISEFSETTVAVSDEGGLAQVPAIRPIRIIDLLTHTAGISYGYGVTEQLYRDAGVIGWYFSDKDESIGESVAKLGDLPFAAQPGERFVYGFATDILGRVVEIVSGMTLDDFFQERIFGPLGLDDTHFYLPPEDADRLVVAYAPNPGGPVVRAPEGAAGQGHFVDGPRTSFSGGAGLVSTAMDYGRFLQMLLNGGELDGVRLLSPKSVELMTTNHVGDLYAGGSMGFGFGFEIIEDVGTAHDYGSPGSYGWGSAYYPRYWVDPEESTVFLFLTQLIPWGNADLRLKFRSLFYQAIIGPVPNDAH